MPQRRVFVTDASAVLQDALIAAVQTIQTAQALTPLTILVPNSSVAVYLRHAIAWAGRGHFGLQFSTLLDFARDCTQDSLIQAGWQPLSPLAAPFIVSNIVQKLLREAGTSPVFASSSRQPGFAAEFAPKAAPEATSGFTRIFLETLADCQQAGIFPDHLRTFIKQARLTGPYRHKIDGIATLYIRYRRFLSERQLYDDHELLERAALLLEAQPDNTRAGDAPASPLFIYGFEKFSPLQRRLLAAAIHGRGDSSDRDVLVFFSWRAGSAYESATPSLNWLRSLGLQYTPLTPAAEYRGSQSAAGVSASGVYKNGLVRVQRRLFEEGIERPEESPEESRINGSDGLLDNSVICLTAPGRSREVREIGRTILGLVRDHDVRFSEIGIFLPDAANYGPVLLETLGGFDIPCFMSGGLPLLQTSAGQALRLLCRMLAEDYARPRVFEFLSVSNPPYAGLLEKKDLGTARGQKLDNISAYIRPDRWEEFSRQASIVRGAEEWRIRLARLEKHYQREAQSAQNPDDLHVLRAFVAFMQDFLALAEQQSSLHTWHGWAEYTLQLCQTYMMPRPETADIEETLLRLAQLDLLQLDLFNDQLGSRLEDKHESASSVTREDWIRAVMNALATATANTNFDTQGDAQGVFVGDVSAARGVRFRVLIVPGLIDGNFPRPARQDPLLLDAERQHLAETVGCEIRQRSQQNEEDRLLFSLIAHSATEYLVLTYPSQDQTSGHVHMPSWYLLRVLEALRGTPQTFADLESWCQRVPLVPVYTSPPDKAPNTLDTFEFHLSSIGQAVATGDASPLGYLPNFAPAFFHAQRANVQRWEQERLTPFNGMLESPEARSVLHQRLFPAGVVVSASALEMYARCPFRYFLSAVLGLEPRQDPEQILALRPQDRGLLLHDILYDFFSQLRAAGQLPMADQSDQADQDSHAFSQRLSQTAEKHFAHFAETHPTGFALLWELEKERMHERLALLLKRERQIGAEFVPEAFEAHFGLGMSQRLAEGVSGVSDDMLKSPFFPKIPIQFALDDGEIIDLRGRIDRIDLSTGDQPKARIIDYKTGKLPPGQFAKGMVLQLPLYLFAAQTLRPELVWESARYVGVDGSERNTPAAFTAQTWPEALRTLRHIMTIIVTGVRSGCFFPQPDTCSPCPFPEICGSQVGKQMMRKRNDPRLLAFRQLRRIS